jgi:hypothetical protein
MAYLMHIGFDNSARLCRNVYYFEYKGVRYKLIQNNFRKWCDVLITIIENHNDKKSINEAYTLASAFLSALSWQNDSKIKMWNLGGIGVPKKVQLRKAKSTIHHFPRIPLSGYSRGYDICVIPKIETEEQKVALTVFREALSSNNEYLTFLFLWQVIETGGDNPVRWVDETLLTQNDKVLISNKDIEHLPLNGKSLGDYLCDDCRNAIAHIKRYPGKVELKLDTAEDNLRIAISTNIVKKLAKFYIENKLNLNKNLCLIRKNGKGFPVFVDEEYVKQYPCTIAYKKLELDQIRKRKWH